MKWVQVLLDELSKRITTTTSFITEVKEKRNSVLAIEDILFKYKLNYDELKIDNITLLSDDDFKLILNYIKEPEVVLKVDKFSKNKEIIKLYKSIILKHGDVKNAPQYNTALSELETILFEIKDFIFKYKDEREEHIISLNKVFNTYNNFFIKFKGDTLVDPIFDMISFHDLLNKCGFDLETKRKIKQEVGKLNYDLVINKGLSTNEDEKLLDKYRVILQRKKEQYGNKLLDIQKAFLEEKKTIKIGNVISIIDEFSIKMNETSPKLIQNSLVCLLLEKEINKYDALIKQNKKVTQEMKDETLINCEKLLVISRRKAPKPDSVESKPLKVEKTIKQTVKPKIVLPKLKEEPVKEVKPKEKPLKDDDDLLVEQIEKIVSSNYGLLIKYSDNDTTRLTEISHLHSQYINEEDSVEKTALTVALIVETLRLNLIFFKQILKNYRTSKEEYELEYKKMVQELKEYLKTYEVLKERILNSVKNK